MIAGAIRRRFWSAALLILLLWGACEARTIYVDAGCDGKCDGSSWGDAYRHLQDALAAAGSGDQVWVAQGIYRADETAEHPGGTGDRQAAFDLKAGVRVYGGFKAGGCASEDRDARKYETVLSGDLNENDGDKPEGPEKWTLKEDNSEHVVTVSGADADSVLDGFVIRYGRASYMGGGILNEGGSPTISNCTIVENSAGQKGGGGLHNSGGEARFVGCVFRANRSQYGAGLYNHEASLVMEHCTFEDHEAYKGGGLMNEGGDVVLRYCSFSRNSAGDPGGAICSWNRGSLDLEDCEFTGNQAMGGGAVFGDGQAKRCRFVANSASFYGGAVDGTNLEVSNCIFCVNRAGTGGAIHGRGKVEVANCLFVRNSAEKGDAIWSGSGRDAELTLTHSTLAENYSPEKGAALEAGGRVAIVNSIFWDNRNEDGCDEAAQLSVGREGPKISHCCVQGWTGQWGGDGNISSGPSFVATEKGDFRLLSHSLCVDTGCDSEVRDDLDGKGRPAGRAPDMGAYEWVEGGANDGRVPVEVPQGVTLLYFGNRDPDLTPPLFLMTYARADNDCDYQQPYLDDGGSFVSLPAEVRKKMLAFTLAVFQNSRYEAEQRYADLFGPVFQLDVPDTESLHAYVWKINGVFSFSSVILLHDVATDTVTSEPIRTIHRWRPYVRPYVGFDDIDGDGRPEVVLTQAEHCGTECTSTVYSYYHVGDDLSLVRVAARESDMPSRYGLNEQGSYGMVMRRFENAGPNRVKLVVRLEDRNGKAATRDVGWAVFESDGPGQPFEVRERHVVDEDNRKYVDELVTLADWDWLGEFK